MKGGAEKREERKKAKVNAGVEKIEEERGKEKVNPGAEKIEEKKREKEDETKSKTPEK